METTGAQEYPRPRTDRSAPGLRKEAQPHVPREVRVPRSAERRGGAHDPGALRGRGEGARRRAEPDPADEAPLRLSASARRHQPHRRARHDPGGQRLPVDRRPRAPQGLRALAALCKGATASSGTRRRRSPTRSCATSARSSARSRTPTRRETGARRSSPPARELEVASSGGTRTIPLDELFQGPFTTSLQPNEIATAVQVPDPGARAGGTYLKLERKVGDYATVGVAVHLSFDNGTVGRAGIALTGVGPTNLRRRDRRGGARRRRAERRHDQGGGASSPPRPRSRGATSAGAPTTSGASSASSRSEGSARPPRRRPREELTMTETAVETGRVHAPGHRDGQRRRALGRDRDAAPARPLPPRDARRSPARTSAATRRAAARARCSWTGRR